MRPIALMAKFGDALDDLATYLKRPTSRGRVAMVVYPPPVERKVEHQLTDYAARLEEMGLRVNAVNVNSIVNSVLESRLDDVADAWSSQRDDAKLAISQPSRKQLIQATMTADKVSDVILWTRVGGAYPFLSIAAVSESMIGKLVATLVIFYPGSLEGKTSFRLLNQRDGYQYRLDYVDVVDV
jgi:hypothetical protein